MMGSRTLSLQLNTHFLFLNTSYKVSRARACFPTSMNSAIEEDRVLESGNMEMGKERLYSPVARLSAFSGRWPYLAMIAVVRMGYQDSFFDFSLLQSEVSRMDIKES